MKCEHCGHEQVEIGHDLLAYWQRLYKASQRMLALALRENRVRDECLAIAKAALDHYDRLGLAIPKKALAQINERLAELEPKEELE